MAKKRSARRGRRRNPASDLTDDLIVEILSRLPVRSLFRCKCVSQSWHVLISHPNHRGRLPQALAGFFYNTVNRGRFPEEARHFTNAFERRRPPLVDPSFDFMPGHENISILDSCNGLLLCRPSKVTCLNAFRYTMCNPATKSWFALPDSGCGSTERIARLGFDPAVSSHYHVFEFVENEDDGCVDGVEIYSSQTGAWSYKESEWSHASISKYENSVFFNGTLHITTTEFAIATVDVKGEAWSMLDVPDNVPFSLSGRRPGFLGRFQGKLCYMNDSDDQSDLLIWVPQGIAANGWTMKHRVSFLHLTEKIITPLQDHHYLVVAIHPDCNMILYVSGWDKTLMAYNIDSEEVHVIQDFGSDCQLPCTPYVPFYSDSWINGH